MALSPFHPVSTYRIQLHAGFTFRDLENILDYLQELGISTIYASPVTTAIKSSQHGYDVTDSLILNPEIGTEQELEKLAALLKKKNMTWLQDIVPNHMAFAASNAWLYDVLERGKNSEYYCFFDIDTDHSVELTGPKIMAPFLGKTLTECLQQKELKLEFQFPEPAADPTITPSPAHGGFLIQYYDNFYPVSIFSYQWICTITEGCPPDLLSSIGVLEQAAQSLAYIPACEGGTPEEQHQALSYWKEVRKKWLEDVSVKEEWKTFLRQRVTFFNEQVSLLAELLGHQHYILTHAALASSRINYRRFFTVNSLICLRMEDPLVFSTYHQKIREWVLKGYIQGLRIDHIDGLAYPRLYIERLRELFGRDGYIIAEKIQAADESLPAGWKLEGSTGYDFLALVNQLLIDENGYRELQFFYREKIQDTPEYADLVFTRKYDFLKTQMGGEWNNLTDLLMNLPLPETEKMNRDRLKEALAIFMASFPVYKVYPELPIAHKLLPGTSNLHTQVPVAGQNRDETGNSYPASSRQIIRETFLKARERIVQNTDRASGESPDTAFPLSIGDPSSDTPELDYLEQLFEESNDFEIDKQRKTFQARLMQFTGPLAAKGIEDTVFYVYNPLISRNEVGDSPGLPGMEAAVFHEKMTQRQAALPYSMNATATHDTKRGEDSRIRISWLTAIPSEWMEKVLAWRNINKELVQLHPTRISRTIGGSAPSTNDEYLIYQSLVGSFPTDLLVTDDYRQRMHAYLTKALREAKTHTFWDHPDEAYEKACHEFLTAILEKGSAFLEDFIPFVYKVIRNSLVYSLSQVLIKMTAPGVPDFYQGSEYTDLSLVDPDNRRPVDYELQKNLLKKIKSAGDSLPDFITHKGGEKLFTVHRTLAYRNQYPSVFSEGDYLPVEVPAPLLAYVRRYKEDWALIIVPLIRIDTPIPNTFSISLPPGAPMHWTNLFTNATTDTGSPRLNLNEVFSQFPVALFAGH